MSSGLNYSLAVSVTYNWWMHILLAGKVKTLTLKKALVHSQIRYFILSIAIVGLRRHSSQTRTKCKQGKQRLSRNCGGSNDERPTCDFIPYFCIRRFVFTCTLSFTVRPKDKIIIFMDDESGENVCESQVPFPAQRVHSSMWENDRISKEKHSESHATVAMNGRNIFRMNTNKEKCKIRKRWLFQAILSFTCAEYPNREANERIVQRIMLLISVLKISSRAPSRRRIQSRIKKNATRSIHLQIVVRRIEHARNVQSNTE